jgi:hypothetical protein
MVLGSSTWMQPAGVLGELEPIDTITRTIAAIAPTASATRTSSFSRRVVSRSGVLTFCQWP